MREIKLHEELNIKISDPFKATNVYNVKRPNAKPTQQIK